MLKRHCAEVRGPLSALLKRDVRWKTRASGLATAAEAVGAIERGMTLLGVTKGAFSMLDLIEHVLSATGPADVDVSTWTMGVYDADALWQFAARGDIRRIRFLLDPSMFGGQGARRAELAKSFIAAFGAASMRAVDNHAKFTLIGNDDWRVSISSSMNLNRNVRLENFVVIEDVGVHRFYADIVDAVFSSVDEFWVGGRVLADQQFKSLHIGGAVKDVVTVW